MDNYTPADKDPQLWAMAKRRASFKKHLATYIIVNAFLWFLWFAGGAHTNGMLPWPLWSTMGWGIGVAFNYIGAYVTAGSDHTEREYQKLTQNKKYGSS